MVYTRAVFNLERQLTQKEKQVIAELTAMFQPSLVAKKAITEGGEEVV